MTKVIKKIFDLILLLIIVILCLYFALRSLNKILIYSVKTGSMEDNIHAGDYILIIKKDDYRVGDIVTFKKNDGFITHRIVNKDGDVITTKGDANNTEDDNIDKKDIVGKVIISGGMLNFIIRYKYILAGLLLSLYLFSCYFTESKEKNEILEKEQEEIEVDTENQEVSDEVDDESSEDKKEEEIKDSEDKTKKKKSKKNDL